MRRACRGPDRSGPGRRLLGRAGPGRGAEPDDRVADPGAEPVAHAVGHAVGHAEAQAAAGGQPADRAGRRTEAAGDRGEDRRHRATAAPSSASSTPTSSTSSRSRAARPGCSRSSPAGSPRWWGRCAAPATPTPSCWPRTASPRWRIPAAPRRRVIRLRRSSVVDAGPQRQGAVYRRLGSRVAPYNLVVDMAALRRRLHGAPGRGTSACAGPPPTRGWRGPGGSAPSRSLCGRTRGRVPLGRRRPAAGCCSTGRHAAPHGRRPADLHAQPGRASSAARRIDPTTSTCSARRRSTRPLSAPAGCWSSADGRVLSGTWPRARAAGAHLVPGRVRPAAHARRPGSAWVLLAATGGPGARSRSATRSSAGAAPVRVDRA